MAISKYLTRNCNGGKRLVSIRKIILKLKKNINQKYANGKNSFQIV
jgi:hypothetical protein